MITICIKYIVNIDVRLDILWSRAPFTQSIPSSHQASGREIDTVEGVTLARKVGARVSQLATSALEDRELRMLLLRK